MFAEVIEIRAAGDHRLWARFADGVAGEVDLSSELWGEMFESLKDPAEFRKAKVDPELGTVVWPNGADFAPEFLYEKVNDDPDGRMQHESVFPR